MDDSISTPRRKGGAPSEFTQEIADEICEQLADGVSLRKICAAKKMPNRATVFRWLAQREDFAKQYTRAREAQADAIADEILYLADTSRMGVKTTTLANGKVEKVRGDMVERARLQIDVRKWYAGKLRPKVYGDKVQTEHSGSVGVAQANMTAAEFKEIARGVASEV